MTDWLLRLLRVPHKPDPPPGAGADLSVFRSSRKHFYYGVAAWLLRQSGALFGLMVSLAVFGTLDLWFLDIGDATRQFDRDVTINLGLFSVEAPLLSLLSIAEVLAVGVFLTQLVVSGLLLRLNWQQRWYMVSKSSLRLREGLFRIREQTMTVANIQNIQVKQGPIQRLLGIADLEVETAGGGGRTQQHEKKGLGHNLHLGVFHGLDDANGLRNRLREVVALHRDSGLGDPDDIQGSSRTAEQGTSGSSIGAVEAIREVVAEARRLRAALGG